MDEFSFVSGETICRNENNQIIAKNTKYSRDNREVSTIMERLDAIDLSKDDLSTHSYDDEIDSFEKQSYDDDFSNVVFIVKLNY